MNIKTRAYLFITLAMVAGALFPIALKVATSNGATIYAFMFLSYIIATITSFALVVTTGNMKQLREYAKNPREYVKIGLAGFAFAGLIFYGLIYSEQFISATLATVIYRMQPLLMLLFVPFILRERVSKTQIAALLLAFVGIYIAVSGGSLLKISSADTGTIMMLFGMVVVSTFAGVFIKRYTSNMESTMFMFNSVSLVFATVLFLYTGAHLFALNAYSVAALLYMGIPTSVGVTYFYFKAFRTLKTTFVTNFYCLSPFITAVFASILLNEAIQPYYLAIAALVIVGIFIQRFDKKGGTYVAKSRSSNPIGDYLQIFDVTSAFLNTKVDAIGNTMKGNGRVLAVKLDRDTYDRIKDSMDRERLNQENSIFVYANSDGHLVSEEENSFISDILGVSQNETVLMSAGRPEASEEFFGTVRSKIKTD
jgi:drug/metabolite transporter (DMT)-like permease